VIREQEYIKLKSNYRGLKDEKHKTNAQNEQRIEQYNNEIRENTEENKQLQDSIKELEDQIQELVNSFSKIVSTYKLQTTIRVRLLKNMKMRLRHSLISLKVIHKNMKVSQTLKKLKKT